MYHRPTCEVCAGTVQRMCPCPGLTRRPVASQQYTMYCWSSSEARGSHRAAPMITQQSKAQCTHHRTHGLGHSRVRQRKLPQEQILPRQGGAAHQPQHSATTSTRRRTKGSSEQRNQVEQTAQGPAPAFAGSKDSRLAMQGGKAKDTGTDSRRAKHPTCRKELARGSSGITCRG